MKKPIIGEAARLVILFVIGCLIGLLITAFLGSCTRTVYTPVETVTLRTDTIYSAKVRVDSVIFRDSVSLIQRGDTVFVTKYRDRYRVRERVDTVYSSATDSVTVRVPYPVERQLSKWEQVKMEAGGWAIGAGSVLFVALVAVIVWLIKVKRRR